MIFERCIIVILFLNISKYVLTKENTTISAQTHNSERTRCERITSCASMSRGRLPYCYCDYVCYKYRDCCKHLLVSGNQTTEFSSDIDDPYSTSTCLMIEGDTVGFWAVNRCGRYGTVCSEKTVISNFVLDPPVTDSRNVTYYNAECAICNNVTTFKTWDIIVAETYYSMSSVNSESTFAESVFGVNITRMLPVLGKSKLYPSLDIPLRVCYGKSQDSEHCTQFQHPALDEKYDYFKDKECCEHASIGKCVLASDRYPGSCMYIVYQDIHLRRVDLAYNVWSDVTKGFQILLEFSRYDRKVTGDQKCSADDEEVPSNEKCRSFDVDSLRQNLRISKYPIKADTLHLVTYEPYDSEVTDAIVRAVLTFLMETKWRIGFKELYSYISIAEGYDCTKSHHICTSLNFVWPLISLNILTVADTVHLESWMNDLRFDVYVMSPTATTHAFGSYSFDPSFSTSCICSKKNTDVVTKHFQIKGIKHLPIASNDLSDECVNITLTVNYDNDSEEMRISCSLEDVENKSVKLYGYLISIYVLIIQKFM